MTELLEVRDAHKRYGRRQQIHALKGVNLRVEDRVSVGIAGESGSGKSTMLKLMLQLETPTEGEVLFRGRPIAKPGTREYREYRSTVQTVFQDPGSSFDPRHRIWRNATEPAWQAFGLSEGQRRELAVELLQSVDLSSKMLDRYPHQLSGGERQRVAIARALSSKPQVILLDEPVTSLDISLRGHVINLLNRKAEEAGVSYIVVSHDLTAIYHLTQYLIVMQHGQIIEEGPTIDVIREPLHPYTQRLVLAVGDPRDAQKVPDALIDNADGRVLRRVNGDRMLACTEAEYEKALERPGS